MEKEVKVVLLALFIISSLSSFSMSITTDWTQDSRKILKLACSEEEVTCEKVCQKSTCEIEEKVCVDCVGTSITMTFAFQEMGRILHNTGESVDAYFLADLINSKNFITLTSRSLYNLVDRFNSFSLRSKFSSLCDDGTRYPTVFFNKLRSGRMGSVSAVHCESGVFVMSDDPTIIRDNQDLF
jgi:hypothetical protein